jgi:hypothetical protein
MDNELRRIGPSDLLMIAHRADDSLARSRETTSPTTSVWSSSTAEVCGGCGGAGYYLLPVPYGHPQWGKLQPCACKQQRDAIQAAEQLTGQINAERGRYATATLASFDWDRMCPKRLSGMRTR